MSRSEPETYTDANRAAWNASALLHAESPAWDDLRNAAAQPGFSALDDTLTQTLTDLDLKDASAGQICCNNARELLSLRSLGITPVWGVDGAEAFLEQARVLADASGQTPRFVCCDVYDLPEDLEPVDLLLITIGVLNWMPDLNRFFDAVARRIAPGGLLVIYETHPILEMFDTKADDPFALAFSYFERAPDVDTGAITYDGTSKEVEIASYWFQHTMGEIVTAIARAGLRVEVLQEHAHSNREPEYDQYVGREAQVPMCYTLVARYT